MAEYLNIPHIENVLKIIELKEKSIIVERDMANNNILNPGKVCE